MSEHTLRGPLRAATWPSTPRGLGVEVLGEIVPYVRVGRERHTPRAERYHAWKASFEATLADQVTAQARTGLPWPAGAIAVGVDIHRYSQRGDVDNLAKAVLDAANGVLWADDAQIVDLHVRLIPCPRGEDRALIDIVPDRTYADELREARR